MDLNKPVEKNGIIHDGVVGDWHRWVGIVTAQYVVTFYVSLVIVTYIKNRWFEGTMPYPLDPKYLLMLIPIGILMGEGKYRDDLKANGKK